MTEKRIVPKSRAGGVGIIAAKAQSLVRVEEQSLRLSNIQIRKNISDSGVLELAIAMAVSGKDLELRNGEIVEVQDADGQSVRIGVDAKIKLFPLLSSKLLPSVKSITVDAGSSDNDANAQWVDALQNYKENPPNGK